VVELSRLGAPGLTASTFASYVAVAGQALRTLLVARLLGPQAFGLLNIANVTANLTTLADMATGIAGEQRASEARGRGDLEGSTKALTDAASARMIAAYAVLGLSLLGTVVAFGSGRTMAASCLLFVGVSAPLQNAAMSARGHLRVAGHFSLLMWAQSAQVVVWLVAVPIAAWSWQLPGAFVAMAASHVPFLLVAARKSPFFTLFIPRYAAFAGLKRPGFRIWLVQITSFLFLNVDQLLVALLLGPTATGLYGVAMLAATALVAFSDGAAAAGHVKTLEEVARRGRLTADLPSVTTVMHIVQLGFGILVPLSWLAMGLLLDTALKDYLPALGALVLLGAAASLAGVVNASNAALISVGFHRPVPGMLAAATAVKVVLVLPAIWFLPDLVAVAASAVIASGVFASLYLRRLWQALGATPKMLNRLLLEHLSGPALITLLAIGTATAFQLRGLEGFWPAATAALFVAGPVHIFTYFRWRRRFAPAPSRDTELRQLLNEDRP
jgi:O-antigen/teichoic acid export membrane protein